MYCVNMTMVLVLFKLLRRNLTSTARNPITDPTRRSTFERYRLDSFCHNVQADIVQVSTPDSSTFLETRYIEADQRGSLKLLLA